MPSLRFNYTTDHHFSHRPPGRRQGDYWVDLSSKMDQVSAHCRDTGSIPLFGGDLFHLKDPSKIATFPLLNFVGAMGTLLSRFPQAPLCAVGNHDIRFDRLSTLPEQPLGLLSSTGVVDLLCNYNPLNLDTWDAPSGHTYLVEKVLSGKSFSTNEGSHVYVYSTPYIEDPQDLLAYLGSSVFHTALGRFVQQSFPEVSVAQSLTGILLLHTLSGPSGGEFYGLQRASYGAIHAALSNSSLGRATSAVLFGHEHSELADSVFPLDQSPIPFNNLPSGFYLATTGTIYINPASFSRSSLDYTSEEDSERSVYMVELTYTPSPTGLGLGAVKIPLQTRPITQLFGVSSLEDPLSQDGDDPIITDPLPVWTSFNEALTKLESTSVNPYEYLVTRLQEEPLQVAAAVKTLLTP